MAGYNTTQNRKITRRATISALALAALAFCGMAAAEQLYVNESGWWRDEGAFNASGAPIQAAVDAAGERDSIYVHGGNYYENVNVNKERLTLEGAGADVVAVTAANSGDHVFDVTADYVNISDFAVRGATDDGMIGIYLNNVDCCNISGNNVYGNYRGIWLGSSSNNTLTSNTANSNNDYGIRLYSSSNNNLTSNNASNNDYGIILCYSSNNTLTSNTADSDNYRGIILYYSSNNTLANNTANSNDRFGIYLRYSSNTASDNYRGIWLLSSSNNTLTSNTADSNSVYGIYLTSSSNNTLANNKYGSGIWLKSSSNNTLANNTANSNNDYGIYLESSSDNTLTNNNASNNGYGIYLESSSNNTLASNTADSNNGYGIWLGSSSNNTLTSNTANSNNDYGIYLYNADDNNITCNLVQGNGQGFYLTSGRTGNNISCNNIIENGNYNTGTGGWEWQFYTAQYQPVEAKHNYWGAGMNNSTIDASIYDNEEGWGEVEFYPFETEPVQCPRTPDEPPAFTTTDAVIALEIAVGSRPFDPRWDVSGDGSVTSLDALMILQAAVGGISLGYI
jgi:parallel beta-helix repeat protein